MHLWSKYLEYTKLDDVGVFDYITKYYMIPSYTLGNVDMINNARMLFEVHVYIHIYNLE